MAPRLRVSIGQHSDRGRKESNQDFFGACLPEEPQLSAKGIAVALADGVSSSQVSRAASEAAVASFLEDYYCTSEAWSVKKSAHQVLRAVNSWLYSQTRQSPYRYDLEKGYVCTLSALVIKSTTAHLFHVGDSRIYRLQGRSMEPLTEEHRVWQGEDRHYLSNALGMGEQLQVDYRALSIDSGDVFVLATDGVHEFVDPAFMAAAIESQDLDAAARAITAEASARGSHDNLTIQIVRIDELPLLQAGEVHQKLTELPFPPPLQPRMRFDGYTIVRELHHSHRSHVHLAVDDATGERVVIKTPSTDLQHDTAGLERFLMEDWIASRVSSPHLLKPSAGKRRRSHLYVAVEFVEGCTLRQWMIDHPSPDLDTVRGVLEQVARGLLAMHRMEMLHQDLRPENIMIDAQGTAKIIDFGATRVAGIVEIDSPLERMHLLGTVQYAAPEYFLGESGTQRSDQFSLAVIAYEMLSGRLPYGADVARCRTRAEQRTLKYRSVLDFRRGMPEWLDDVLEKALRPWPERRYAEVSEFIHDLRHPPPDYLHRRRPRLIERNPIAFWKSVSLILVTVVLYLLARLTSG